MWVGPSSYRALAELSPSSYRAPALQPLGAHRVDQRRGQQAGCAEGVRLFGQSACVLGDGHLGADIGSEIGAVTAAAGARALALIFPRAFALATAPAILPKGQYKDPSLPV